MIVNVWILAKMYVTSAINIKVTIWWVFFQFCRIVIRLLSATYYFWLRFLNFAVGFSAKECPKKLNLAVCGHFLKNKSYSLTPIHQNFTLIFIRRLIHEILSSIFDFCRGLFEYRRDRVRFPKVEIVAMM